MQKSKLLLGTSAFLLLLIFILSRCMDAANASGDPRGRAFAGSASCKSCHQSIYDSVLRTAHYNASAPVTKKNVLGNFHAGQNTFYYDSITKIVMEKRDSGLYQVLYSNGIEKEAHRFDLLFGVRHAQTFLYWNKDQTFELPISYYRSVNTWATSPGFSATVPNFQRLIGKDCYECHSSFVRDKETDGGGDNYFSSRDNIEVLEKNSLVFGIDCERCHGPAAQHVNYHQENPTEKTAKHIIVINKLTQQQQLDNCAVCHSGNDQRKLKSRFRFFPGDTLANFFLPSFNMGNNTGFDVHGNQYRLLSTSKCFLKTNTITCSTCHSPHNNASPDLSVYSQQCISCHAPASNQFCTTTPAPDATLTANCINCHMPQQASDAISFQLSGNSKTSSYYLRTHKIGVYTNTETGQEHTR